MNGRIDATARHAWRGWMAGAAIAAAAVLAACGGGGGGDAGAGAGGAAASLTVGPVSGFGSIIVNGVRFDDSGVRVFDDDGVDVTAERRVQLGTMVEVDSGRIDDGTRRATATTIRLGSEIKGPVQSLGSTPDSLVLLGQTVRLTPSTVFDDSLAGATPATLVGLVVEAHVIFDSATGSWTATRLEREDADTSAYKLRGVVAGLDRAARRFTIGAARIDYTGVAEADLPAGFADGRRVRVRLATTPAADGSWSATRIRHGERRMEDRDEAEVRGRVTALTSPTRFEVDGLPVDAGGARFDDGPVAVGELVEVEGRVESGVLMAQKVEREDRDGGTDDAQFELHGAPSQVDTSVNRFVLRGLTVRYSDTATAFERGSEALLAAPGVALEVKGTLSADRTTLQATRIRFED